MPDLDENWAPDSVSVCAGCAKHSEIRALAESALAKGVCGVCGHPGVVFDPEQFGKMRNLIRALIRFHFNEDAYNGHWGGTSVAEVLLKQPNPLLQNLGFSDYADDLVERIETEGGVYPAYEEGICLYAGNDETGRLIQFSIQETLCTPLRDIEMRLERENYHLVEPAMEKLLKRIEADLDHWIDEGVFWFRSRTDVKHRSLHVSLQGVTLVAVPFTAGDIGALSPKAASAGRTNRQGVSVLYLASDVETALAEIRPHPGHLISVGGFRARKKLRIASFDQPIGRFSSSDLRLDDFAIIHHIDALLRQPVVPEERHRYAGTQLLADMLMRRGFDGIAFGSSVGPGQNVCIFDPSQFEFVESQSLVKRVEQLEYAFSDVALAPPSDS